MSPGNRRTWALISLLMISNFYIETSASKLDPFAAKKKRMSEKVRMMYHEADMRTGRATYWQLTSLQAFWPGLRYLLDRQMLHPTEKYYPLRPELAESTFYLYQATKDPWYLEVGESIVDSLNLHTRVEGGFASIRDVTTMELEDHQHSFFLAETCKYLYLLFDDSFLVNKNYIFTTEGHPLPILSSWHERLPEAYLPVIGHPLREKVQYAIAPLIRSEEQQKRASAMSLRICPASTLNCRNSHPPLESVCHIPDARSDHRCISDEDCGVDSTSCRRRSCSMAGYCGLWLSV
ncbi:UNVERIFIED_CONTAM: Alpha-mannosidase I MNS5 [Sesamum radiatum]|uniref:Alpha-mannosidase I MNS5 n=1 Tax=Sesamum radiatum TaxID=300843 RepID=A0AAW2WHW3_SESRA